MMMTLPPLRSLQVFEAVVRCGGMTAAADELNVSTGAISQQIKLLETFLGARLLERQGRSLELTTWGRIYHQHIQSAFDGIRLAQSILTKARTKSELAISTLPSLAIRWLRPLVQDWQAANPGTTVLLVGTDEEPNLEDDGIDFRITYGSDAKAFDHYSELFVDQVVPTCSPAFLKTISIDGPSDILKAPLIHIAWDLSHQPPPSWEDWARSINVPQKISGGLAFSLSSAAIDAAVNGGGFVLGQHSMIREELNDGRLVIPFEHSIPMPQPYFVAWTRAAIDTTAGLGFRSFLQAAARRHTRLSKTLA
jgi:LysR family transcriptional regulator, glycine cleavage system transcriptional activator